MLTCCPACGTTFRVTPEQLKARGGKVRCGKCQEVFNAIDRLSAAPEPSLLPGNPDDNGRETSGSVLALPVDAATSGAETATESGLSAGDETRSGAAEGEEAAPGTIDDSAIAASWTAPAIDVSGGPTEVPALSDRPWPDGEGGDARMEPSLSVREDSSVAFSGEGGAEQVPADEGARAEGIADPGTPESAAFPGLSVRADAVDVRDPDDSRIAMGEAVPASPDDAPEGVPAVGENTDAPATEPGGAGSATDAALAAGLVAARETTQVPGYNKWAEGAFTGTPTIDAAAPHPRWPACLAAVLLSVLLAGQAVHYFRTELAVSVPALRPALETFCRALGCDLPLPRHADRISIEASDLQIDTSRSGMLLLTATIQNRAPYAQAWPLIELTLTDTQDTAILRRVLAAEDYLPAGAERTAIAAHGEIGLRLWLETGINAAGYRLYLFYP